MIRKNEKKPERAKLIVRVFIRVIIMFPLMGLILFLPAGTFEYWNAWIYLTALFMLMMSAFIYLTVRDPELLDKRMRMKERQKPQKWYMAFSLLMCTTTFIIPGFDYRYGWSSVPDWLVAVSLCFLVLGYVMFIFVMRQNSYASRIIELQEGQKLIDTGLYSVVRHPMYLAAIIIFVFSVLLLGSFWALMPLILLPAVIAFRIHHEEKMLCNELAGYREYREKVRYRLIPLIW